jgi:gliding motility-associated-like protein
MRVYYLILLCFIVANYNCVSQNSLTITEGPIYTMPCPNACVMLHANYPHPLKTNTYNAVTTPYAPNAISGTVLALADDTFSSAIPIGFTFCFFENTYTQCYIADNGVLSFNSNYSNASCNTNTQQLLPYFNSTFPDLGIFGVYMDLDPNLGGQITYATIGTAPFRKFVVNYSNMRIFGSTCNTNTSTFQIVLYETTNEVDVHITDKATCDANTTNYSNYGTVGVQNIGATAAFTAPGKHASIFNATNEGIKILPAGAPNYIMEWRNAGNQLLTTNVDSLWFCPTVYPYNYITTTLYLACPADTFIDTVQIIKPLPNIINLSIVQPPCPGQATGSITFSGSGTAPPFTYAINNGIASNSNVFNNLYSGFYILSVYDSNGCRKDTVITLPAINNPGAIVDSINYPFCPIENGMVAIHGYGGTAPYSISWNNGDTGQIITNLGPGIYIATVVDAMGCTAEIFIPLDNDPASLPHGNYIVDHASCSQPNGNINLVNVFGGTAPYVYNWSNGSNNDSLLNVVSGNYFVTITDVNGCVNDTNFTIANLYGLTSTQDTIHTLCGLANGSAIVYATGGTGPFTYTWTGSSSITSVASNLAAGTYVCTTTNTNGCSVVDSFLVFSSPANINNISKANANCDTSNGIITLTSITNGVPPFTISWSNGAIGTSINYLSPGTYTVESIDFNGCKDKDTLIILNDGKPQLGIVTYQQPSCHGDSNGSVTLTGSNGTSPYKYSLDGITYSSFATLINISGGNYTIYITDANSCINDTVVYFTQPDSLYITSQADTVACSTDSTGNISFTAAGGQPSYTYTFNNGSTNNITAYSNLPAGIYTIQVTDATNCKEDFEIEVFGPSLPLNLNLEKSDIPCFTGNIGFVHPQISGGWPPYNFTWSNGATTLNLDNLGAMILTLEIVDSRNCEIDKSVSIQKLLCCKMVVPNAFSPNADNINDDLNVMSISDVEWMDFRVFNRYGIQIFQSDNVHNKWDGTFNRKDYDMGTYFYTLKYKCPFSENIQFMKGDISLLH